MNGYRGDTDTRSASTVLLVRMVAVGMAASVLIMALVAGWLLRDAGAGFLVGPVAVFGIVSLPIGFRLFQWLRERVPREAGVTQRHAHFVRASALSFTVTEVAAVLGIFVFALSDELSALIGVVSHVILTGALWPTEERLQTFLEAQASFTQE